MLYSTNGTAFTTYYYILNLQGDVVKLIGTDGSIAASYTYDAWGNILSSSGTMAEKNPLRYRGYYYDSEIGYYYLQSRYYDPTTRRFLNADSLASTGQGFVGTNMFAYCNNCPVIFTDTLGKSPRSAITIIGDSDDADECGWINEIYEYVYAPNGFTTTIIDVSPYDSRATLTRKITYMSPSQVKEFVKQNALQKNTEPLKISDILGDVVPSVVAAILSKIASPVVGIGIEAEVAWIKYYGKAQQSRDARAIVDIMNANTGMVVVEYSTYGAHGRWYLPWDKDTERGEYGSYPYARIS